MKIKEEKKIKALENRVEKIFSDTDQKPITSFFSKGFLNEEATYKFKKNVEMENNLHRNDIIYKKATRKRIKYLILKSLKQ